MVIEGMHITEHNVNSLRNAKIRAEARLGLKRQRKQPLTAMYSTSSLPEKILDMHGNKTSNPEAPDATVVVDVEKLQKKCLGLGTPSFLERVKMEFELKQKARATAAAAASSSSSRPGTAPGSSVSSPSNFIKRNKERVDQARLSEREKVYADLRNQRSAKELRVVDVYCAAHLPCSPPCTFILLVLDIDGTNNKEGEAAPAPAVPIVRKYFR